MTQRDNPELLPDHKKIATIARATTADQEILESTTSWAWIRGQVRRQFLRYYWAYPPLWRVGLRSFSSHRMTPAFASLGAPRSGTTMLADYIMQHPCVVLPLAKEIHSAIPTLRMIQAQFPSLREQRRVQKKYGMAITGYCAPVMPSLLFPYALRNVADQLKLIVILRNPVERTFAHWRYGQLLTKRLHRDPLWKNQPDFAETIQVELEAMESRATSGFTTFACGGFIQNSIYLPFLKLMFRFYDRHDSMIINADSFFADPVGTAKGIYEFLGLPPYEPALQQVRNAGPPGKMEPETRQALVEFFEPLNQQLYEYVGIDYGWR